MRKCKCAVPKVTDDSKFHLLKSKWDNAVLVPTPISQTGIIGYFLRYMQLRSLIHVS